MAFESNVVNTIGILLEIVGIFVLLTGTKRLERSSGGFQGPEYQDSKTKLPPPILTLPNERRTIISVVIAAIGLALQIAATWIVA